MHKRVWIALNQVCITLFLGLLGTESLVQSSSKSSELIRLRNERLRLHQQALTEGVDHRQVIEKLSKDQVQVGLELAKAAGIPTRELKEMGFEIAPSLHPDADARSKLAARLYQIYGVRTLYTPGKIPQAEASSNAFTGIHTVSSYLLTGDVLKRGLDQILSGIPHEVMHLALTREAMKRGNSTYSLAYFDRRKSLPEPERRAIFTDRLHFQEKATYASQIRSLLGLKKKLSQQNDPVQLKRLDDFLDQSIAHLKNILSTQKRVTAQALLAIHQPSPRVEQKTYTVPGRQLVRQVIEIDIGIGEPGEILQHTLYWKPGQKMTDWLTHTENALQKNRESLEATEKALNQLIADQNLKIAIEMSQAARMDLPRDQWWNHSVDPLYEFSRVELKEMESPVVRSARPAILVPVGALSGVALGAGLIQGVRHQVKSTPPETE